VQAAIAVKTPGRVLVPISNWASFGGSKDVIIWLPIDMIAQTITGLVALRKEIISDIYQMMGLSDIMRGATDPQETLGAQQLKTQYGSTRVRDKQQELVRLARDLVEITSEIITEKFDPVTMIEMAQTQLPTSAMKQKTIMELQQNIQGMVQQQQMQAMQAQQAPPQPGQPPAPPQQPQEQPELQQAITELQRAQEKPTIEQVLYFLKDNRAKSFVLDIETDSTIERDEAAEKKARSEFVQVLAQLLPQLAQMIQSEPKTAEFCGELLKFATAPFRAGRSLDSSVDKLVEQMKLKADQPRGDDATTAQNKTMLQIEQLKDQTEKEKIRADTGIKAAQLKQQDAHKQQDLANQRTLKQMELNAKQGDADGKIQVQNQKAMESREAHQAHMIEKNQDMALNRQKMDLAVQSNNMKRNDLATRANERQMAFQAKQQQGLMKP
jgi:hypothetical protein